MKEFKIYSAGKFIEGPIALNVHCSYDNQIIAQTTLADEKIAQESIKKAQQVQEEMKMMSAHKKAQILLEIKKGLEDNIEEMTNILSLEACKPFSYAKGEVLRAIENFQTAAEEAKRLPKEYIGLDGAKNGENKEGIIKHFPVGLVLGISPFNFPLNLAVHKIAPAIAAGCPIILKPATQTPCSTLLLAKIIDQSSLPKGAVSILPMDRELGNKLVKDDRFKLLSFTGSPEVGFHLKNNCGKKKVLLELGGNAGLIITESSDIDKALDQAIVGAFAYQGQVCIHTQRIYIHESKFDDFVENFLTKTNNLKYGSPTDQDVNFSNMISEKQAQDSYKKILESQKLGAKVLNKVEVNNSYHSPVVMTDTNPTMPVNSSEVFSPVVVLEKYSFFKDAVTLINDSNYGLQAGVFTNNLKEINYAFENLEVGGVIINGTPTFRVDHMPYGGIKDSGLGREGIKYSIHEMMEPKILVWDKSF
jgi:acyl-CoA reductase-like NAD-dependent aldehyde dehydrogenase